MKNFRVFKALLKIRFQNLMMFRFGFWGGHGFQFRLRDRSGDWLGLRKGGRLGGHRLGWDGGIPGGRRRGVGRGSALPAGRQSGQTQQRGQRRDTPSFQYIHLLGSGQKEKPSAPHWDERQPFRGTTHIRACGARSSLR